MIPEQEIQWREEFEEYFAATKPYLFSILKDKKKTEFEISKLKFSIGYVSARKKAQEEIDRLSNRNAQLEDFCNEFVYGEENPEYYSTMTDKLKERDKEISQLKEEFEKLRSFCLDYQMYANDILHSVNLFKSFHELRKGAYAYAIARSSKPIWGYEDVESAYYFKGLKSYVEQLKEELKRERETIDSLIKKHEDVGINQYDIYYARQNQQQRKVEL